MATICVHNRLVCAWLERRVAKRVVFVFNFPAPLTRPCSFPHFFPRERFTLCLKCVRSLFVFPTVLLLLLLMSGGGCSVDIEGVLVTEDGSNLTGCGTDVVVKPVTQPKEHALYRAKVCVWACVSVQRTITRSFLPLWRTGGVLPYAGDSLGGSKSFQTNGLIIEWFIGKSTLSMSIITYEWCF